jgi:hypothetical protein
MQSSPHDGGHAGDRDAQTYITTPAAADNESGVSQEGGDDHRGQELHSGGHDVATPPQPLVAVPSGAVHVAAVN